MNPTEIGKSVEWTRIFAQPIPERAHAKNPHECCDACREAREIKCVCACGGKNHGAALKRDVKRLDEFEQPKEAAPYIA